MTDIDRTTGYRLLETGTLTEFRVAKTEIQEGPDAAEFSVHIDLEFPPDPETEETDLDWAAFGFLSSSARCHLRTPGPGNRL